MSALREVLASFGIDFDKEGNLAKGDKQIGGMLEHLKGFGAAVAGAFAVSEIVTFGKELVSQADHLGETAERLNVSTGALQQWQYAAKLSGVEADELTASLQRLGAGLAEAAEGKGQAATFKKLGVDLKKADGTLKSSIEVFEEAGLAIGGIADPTEAAGLAANLFGKQYARLLPLFRQGPEGIAALKKEFEDLGGGFSPEFIKQSEEVNDNLDRLQFGVKSLAIQVLGPILPGIVRLTERLVANAKVLVGWVKGSRALQLGLAALTGKGIAGAIAKLAGLQRTLSRVALAFAEVIGPVLLLDDALGFLAGDDSVIGEGLDKAFGAGTQDHVRGLIKEFGRFLDLFVTGPDQVRATMNRITNDLRTQLGGFGEFIGGWWTAIADEGLFVVNLLTGGWQNFGTKMGALGDGLLLSLRVVWTEIKYGFLLAAAAITDAYGSMWSTMISDAQAAVNLVLDAIAKIPGATEAVKGLRADVSAADRFKPKSVVDVVRGQRDNERLGFAHEYDRLGAVATAPALPAPVTTNNVVNNASPVTNVSVTVNGADAKDANRIGKTVGKASGDANLRAIQAALVPTPR